MRILSIILGFALSQAGLAAERATGTSERFDDTSRSSIEHVNSQRLNEISRIVWTAHYSAALEAHPEQIPLHLLAAFDPKSYHLIAKLISDGEATAFALASLARQGVSGKSRTERETRDAVLEIVEKLPAAPSEAQFSEEVRRWLSTRSNLLDSLILEAYRVSAGTQTDPHKTNAVRDALSQLTRINGALPPPTLDLEKALISGNQSLASMLSRAGSPPEIVNAVLAGTATADQVKREIERVNAQVPDLAHSALASLADQIRRNGSHGDLRSAREFADEARSAVALFGALGRLAGVRDIDLFASVSTHAISAFQAIATMAATGVTFGGFGAVIGAVEGISSAFKARRSSIAEAASLEMLRALLGHLLEMKQMLVAVSRQVSALEGSLLHQLKTTSFRLQLLEVELAELRGITEEGFSDVRKGQAELLRQTPMGSYLAIQTLLEKLDQPLLSDGETSENVAIQLQLRQHLASIEQYAIDAARRPPFIFTGDRDPASWSEAIESWPTDDLVAYLPAALRESGTPDWGHPVVIAEAGNWLLSARRDIGPGLVGRDLHLANVCATASAYCDTLQRAHSFIDRELAAYVVIARGVVAEIDTLMASNIALAGFTPDTELSDTGESLADSSDLMIDPATAEAMFGIRLPIKLIPRLSDYSRAFVETHTHDAPRLHNSWNSTSRSPSVGNPFRPPEWIFDGCVERTTTAFLGRNQTLATNEQGLKRYNGVALADLGTYRYCFVQNPVRVQAFNLAGAYAALDQDMLYIRYSRYGSPSFVDTKHTIAAGRDLSAAQQVAYDLIVTNAARELARAGVIGGLGNAYEDRFVSAHIDAPDASFNFWCWRVGTSYLRVGPTWKLALGPEINSKALPGQIAYSSSSYVRTFSRENSSELTGIISRDGCMRRGHIRAGDPGWQEVELNTVGELGEEERERRHLMVRSLVLLHRNWSEATRAHLIRELNDSRSKLFQLSASLSSQANVLATLGRFAWSNCESPSQIATAMQSGVYSTRQLMQSQSAAALNGRLLHKTANVAELARYRDRLSALIQATENPGSVDAGRTCTGYVPSDLQRFFDRARGAGVRAGWIDSCNCQSKVGDHRIAPEAEDSN